MDSDLKLYYSRRALEYEDIYRKPERQHDLALLKRRVADLLAGCDVLEIACGTGYWTEVFAPAARSVYATDTSAEVLDLARQKSYPPERVEFGFADAYALQVPARRYTAAFSGFWWSHVPRARLRGFLDGLHGALEPGARVLFIDNRYVPGSSSAISRRDEAGDTHQQRTLADGSRYEVLKNFPDEAEAARVLKGAARDIAFEWLQYYWCLSYRVGTA